MNYRTLDGRRAVPGNEVFVQNGTTYARIDDREVSVYPDPENTVPLDAPIAEQAPTSTPPDISGTVSVFTKWLLLPDKKVLYAVLGAIAANRLPGDPVWPVVVGPPGDGKTEILRSTAILEGVHITGTLTEASLLSGTPKRERASDAKGGLLRALGEFGIIVCKDLGSVLSMHRDARATVLAALREIYDGHWVRDIGSEGGRSLEWKGKVGLIAGCTPVIDRHHAVMSTMGERFLLVRTPHVDADKQARRALKHAGREHFMREELSEAVRCLFAAVEERSRNVGWGGEGRALTEDERGKLISVATFVVRARSGVTRDGYSRDVEFVPPPEAPTRLVKVLDRLLAGLDVLGLDRRTSWAVVVGAALDSIPTPRRAALDLLLGSEKPRTTPDLADALDLPTPTTRRTVEDLAAHGVARRIVNGKGKAHSWELTQWAADRYVGALRSVPEMSGGPEAPS